MEINMRTRKCIALLILLLISCTYSVAQQSKTHGTSVYYDAQIFDLKGYVESCTFYLRDENLSDEYDKGATIRFSINGKIEENNETFVRDNRNRIKSRVCRSTDFFGEECVYTWTYSYNDKGQITAEYSSVLEQKEKKQQSYTKTEYFYNSLGHIIKTVNVDLSEDEEFRRINLVKDYKYLEFDVKGNWIKREYIDPITSSKCTELRKISYYSDEELKPHFDLERRKKRINAIIRSVKEGVKNQAPTFGLG